MFDGTQDVSKGERRQCCDNVFHPVIQQQSLLQDERLKFSQQGRPVVQYYTIQSH